MEQVKKNKTTFISKPLFKQTFKSNLVLWLVLTIASAAIFFIINIVICSRNIFANIDMNTVSIYVKDENLSWLQILGLLESMGYNLSKIQILSQIDLNAIISDLVYKIAGVLLPMIYVIITANALIANQVNSGSMAYVLSTPTSRKTVIRTTFLYMFVALIAMYAVIVTAALTSETIAGIIRINARGGEPNMIPVRTILLCTGSFFSMFALTGICFGASAFFNKSSTSLAVGGGICVISFLGCILGLFGSKVFVGVGLGVEAMNVFNYVSIFSLIDTDSISNFAKASAGQDVQTSLSWIWQFATMFGIGAVAASIGSIKFIKKDLPL